MNKTGAVEHLIVAVLAFACGLCAFFFERRRNEALFTTLEGKTRVSAGELTDEARSEAQEILDAAKKDAEESAQKRRDQMHKETTARREQLDKLKERISRRDQSLHKAEDQTKSRGDALRGKEQAYLAIVQRKIDAESRRGSHLKEADATLYRIAEETRAEVRDRLKHEWLEEARAEAKDLLRQVDQGAADPEHSREAKRILELSIQRYQGHYLTERLLSSIPLAPGVGRRIAGKDSEHLAIISEIAHVKLTLSDDETLMRLDGQDSFGREIARRALARFGRALPRNGLDGIRQTVQAISEELDRETLELGRRAFKELEIPRAHPEIVRLVGRLNYRTSYTQNQWKHAIEAAFLCGMMAAELRLDVKTARRAALMHDIGKALTHEIDGSHAVIGADYARRLGESELVANAIGAHHTDEPFNSPFALIVAAADAMSGARPGARHEPADNYVQRIDDLHRITSNFHGVDRAYAVQAGREVRIYVRENQVNDLRAAQMSSEIAQRISEQLVFPGQIKVTVIREVTGSAVAS